jgi:hypothetical protein
MDDLAKEGEGLEDETPEGEEGEVESDGLAPI